MVGNHEQQLQFDRERSQHVPVLLGSQEALPRLTFCQFWEVRDASDERWILLIPELKSPMKDAQFPIHRAGFDLFESLLDISLYLLAGQLRRFDVAQGRVQN